MKFKPIKSSELGAVGNHDDWEIVIAHPTQERVLIRCTCHDSFRDNSDLRWININQLETNE